MKNKEDDVSDPKYGETMPKVGSPPFWMYDRYFFIVGPVLFWVFMVAK